MNRFALLFPVAFASHLVLAQTDRPIGLDAERNLAELGNGKNATMVRTYDNRYEGMKGTPYFNAEWGKATLTAGKNLFHNVEVKYNAYDNHILFRNASGQEFILDPSKVDSFVLRDSKTKQEYRFKKLEELASQNPKLAQRFVLALYDGKGMQFVMVPQKNLVKASYKGAYNTGNKYDELQDEQSYYLLSSPSSVSKVKLNKKGLLKALPDHQGKVESYITAERIDASSEAGWVKALAYYESL